MQSDITFTIDGTTDDDRKTALYDFIVVVSPDFAKEVGLRKNVVVLREIPGAINENGEKKGTLKIYGKIKKDPKLEKYEIRMDQTLRNALGIPFNKGRHQRNDLRFCPLSRN